MKKIMALFCALLASAAAQAAETGNANTATATEDLTMTQNAPKILIAYYSWSGNTKEVAEKIHEEVGGDIFRIETVQPYPEEYHATTTQAKQEINEGFKPELKSKVDNTLNMTWFSLARRIGGAPSHRLSVRFWQKTTCRAKPLYRSSPTAAEASRTRSKT